MLHYSLCVLIVCIGSKLVVDPRHHENRIITGHSPHFYPIK
jgi:exosome complex RNA-binding protein Rrp42 (RNase PH superfamily)